ncbi:MAG: trypsin-like peptidase domain-containing protein, partial [Planctomycetia bacterium]|nr:trypsin-like peptidase domain-containing protein [Planctomycetia bacterium]
MIRSSSILICAILGFTLMWSDAVYAENNPISYTADRPFFGRNKTYVSEDNSVEKGVVLLDFYNDACGPCRAMMPAVQSLVERGYRISKVNTDKFPDWANRFNITKIPCFVVIIDGQEVARHTGVTSEQKLENMLVQAGARPSLRPEKLPRHKERIQIAQSAWQGRETQVSVQEIVAGRFQFHHGQENLLENGLENSSVTTQIATNVNPELKSAEDSGFTPVSTGKTPKTTPVQRWQSVDVSNMVRNGGAPDNGFRNTTENGIVSQNGTVNTSMTTISINESAPQALHNRILAASVRIRVDNMQNNSVATGHGTGTIIDCRSDHALILTCGHLFREFQTGDTISIDIFTENGVQTFPARYVHHDEERDLGLISFTVKREVVVMPLAASNLKIQQGMPIITAGCNGGDVPTLQNGVVTGINRLLRAPNIEVSAVPVQGRSGGGLFTQNGELIGVCFAADPQDQEGLFTSMVAIHDYLKSLKMDQFVLAPRNGSVAFTTPTHSENAQSLTDLPVRENTPTIPFTEVATPTPVTVPTQVTDP